METTKKASLENIRRGKLVQDSATRAKRSVALTGRLGGGVPLGLGQHHAVDGKHIDSHQIADHRRAIKERRVANAMCI